MPWRCARRCRAKGWTRAWRGRARLRDLAREVLAIAREGLRARARRDASGHDETIHLAPLEEIVGGGPTQAEYWLERYHRRVARRRPRIFAEAAI